MAITFVAAAGDNFSVSTGPFVAAPAGIQSNDILISIWVSDTVHDSTGTPPTGWTKIIEHDNGTDSSTSVFWKRSDGTETSINFADIFAATESGREIMLAYRGCFATGDPQDATAVSGAESSTPWDTPSITTVTDDALVIGIFGADPGSDPYTFVWDAGISERIDSDTTPTGQNALLAYIAIGDKIITPAAATTLGGDVSVADSASAIAIALKPAAAVAEFLPRVASVI